MTFSYTSDRFIPSRHHGNSIMASATKSSTDGRSSFTSHQQMLMDALLNVQPSHRYGSRSNSSTNTMTTSSSHPGDASWSLSGQTSLTTQCGGVGNKRSLSASTSSSSSTMISNTSDHHNHPHHSDGGRSDVQSERRQLDLEECECFLLDMSFSRERSFRGHMTDSVVTCGQQENVMSWSVGSKVFFADLSTLEIHGRMKVPCCFVNDGWVSATCNLDARKWVVCNLDTNRVNIVDIDVQKGGVPVWQRDATSIEAPHQGGILCLCGDNDFNPSWFVTGGRDGWIVQHDTRSPSPVHQYRAHYQGVSSVRTWSHGQQQTIASGGENGYVCIFDVSMQKQRLELSHGHTGPVESIDLCWDVPHLMATGGVEDGKINIWDTRNGAIRSSVTCDSGITALHWSPYGPEICTTHSNCCKGDGNDPVTSPLKMWTVEGQNSYNPTIKFWKDRSNLGGSICSADMGPIGRHLVTIGDDCTLRMFDLFDEEEYYAKLCTEDSMTDDEDDNDDKSPAKLGKLELDGWNIR